MTIRKRWASLALMLLLLASASPAAAGPVEDPETSWLERLHGFSQEFLFRVLGWSEDSGEEEDPPAIPDFDPNGATTTLQPLPGDTEILAIPDFDPNG